MTRRTFLGSAAAAAPLHSALAKAVEARRELKITGIQTDLLRLPPAGFTGDAIHDFGAASGGVVLRVQTNAGITGCGYSNFGMIEGGPRVVQTILEAEIKPVLVGQGVSKEDTLGSLARTRIPGCAGRNTFAMSVVDIAVWDILGKAPMSSNPTTGERADRLNGSRLLLLPTALESNSRVTEVEQPT